MNDELQPLLDPYGRPATSRPPASVEPPGSEQKGRERRGIATLLRWLLNNATALTVLATLGGAASSAATAYFSLLASPFAILPFAVAAIAIIFAVVLLVQKIRSRKWITACGYGVLVTVVVFVTYLPPKIASDLSGYEEAGMQAEELDTVSRYISDGWGWVAPRLYVIQFTLKARLKGVSGI